MAYDFLISPTSPITAYAAEEATPGNDPMRPFEHIAFTVPRRSDSHCSHQSSDK